MMLLVCGAWQSPSLFLRPYYPPVDLVGDGTKQNLITVELHRPRLESGWPIEWPICEVNDSLESARKSPSNPTTILTNTLLHCDLISILTPKLGWEGGLGDYGTNSVNRLRPVPRVATARSSLGAWARDLPTIQHHP